MHTHARVAVSPVLFVTSCVVLYGRGVDDTAARVLRGSKRYKPEASVLLQVEFWRVCLDEAQTVESTTAKAAEMASKLHAGVLPCPARCRVSSRVPHAASRACPPRRLYPPARAPTHLLTGFRQSNWLMLFASAAAPRAHQTCPLVQPPALLPPAHAGTL
jgi:hypothetical protein